MIITKQMYQKLTHQPNEDECFEIIKEHGEAVIQKTVSNPKNKEEIDQILICTQFLAYSSQFQQICEYISKCQEFEKLINYVVKNLIEQKQSKLKDLYTAMMVNLTISDEICQQVVQYLQKEQIDKLFQQFLQIQQENYLYLLINLSRFLKRDNQLIIKEMVTQLQERNQCSLYYSQIIRNLFLFERDDMQLKVVFQQFIKDILLELTGNQFYDAYIESLRENELSQNKNFVQKPIHNTDVLFNIVEILLIHVRNDKQSIFEFYPQMRECHKYLIDKQGESEINDALNELIQHAISTD